MSRLSIQHDTLYTYERPVAFGPQRLLLRPRDSHSLRVVEASIILSPPGDTRWTYDAFGNCVCWFTPQGQSTSLSISSRLTIERYPAPLAPLEIEDPRSLMPILYNGEDRAALAPYIIPATDDETPEFLTWVRAQMDRSDEPALDFLLRLNGAIRNGFFYQAREAEGVRSPHETLRLGGTCRDFAWLMVEAARRLGFAARFVTGYLHSPGASMRGAGATHAWCEVFLPDLGWTEFDPTNGLAESEDLIPVAASRTPAEAAPVSGVILGDPGTAELHVDVIVTGGTPLPAAA